MTKTFEDLEKKVEELRIDPKNLSPLIGLLKENTGIVHLIDPRDEKTFRLWNVAGIFFG